MHNILSFTLSFILLITLSTCSNQASTSAGKYNLVPDENKGNNAQYEQKWTAGKLPGTVDLRTIEGAFPPAFNQGNINSCTANAVSAAIYFDMIKQDASHPFVPSRLFIYYEERVLNNTLNEEKYGVIGATVSMKNCIDAVHNKGYCSEKTWPYETTKLYTKPSPLAYDSAEYHHTYQYQWLKTDLEHLKDCLANGYPFVFGISIYESFESATTKSSGIVSMPAATEKKLGGHALLAVGYDDEKQQFIFRNSYGGNWGDGGYGFMPYAFMQQYGFSFWEIKKVKG